MKEKSLQIINHYGIENQQRKLSEEVFELQKAITEYEYELDGCNYTAITDMLFEHIEEEFADVLVILRQFYEHYELDFKKELKIMEQKVDRQLERIKDDRTNR